MPYELTQVNANANGGIPNRMKLVHLDARHLCFANARAGAAVITTTTITTMTTRMRDGGG